MTQQITIRIAQHADAEGLARLAALDGSHPPTGRVLLAEADGRLRAATSLDDGKVIADPFERTAETVALLELRAGQLAGAGERRHAERSGTPIRARLRLRVRPSGPSSALPQQR